MVYREQEIKELDKNEEPGMIKGLKAIGIDRIDAERVLSDIPNIIIYFNKGYKLCCYWHSNGEWMENNFELMCPNGINLIPGLSKKKKRRLEQFCKDILKKEQIKASSRAWNAARKARRQFATALEKIQKETK